MDWTLSLECSSPSALGQSQAAFIKPSSNRMVWVLQRSHMELHGGAQLKGKRQWLEVATWEILITHRKIFIYVEMAKTLE